jgi:3-oxoadipate enol-lactonase
MINAYRSGNKRQALELFSDPVFGPNWQSIIERAVPGGVEQAIKDFDTFMQEQATIQDWQFGPAEAAAIRQPMLSVIGLRSTPLAKKSRELLHSWFPQLEELDLDTTHLLQMQDPEDMARGLAEFFGRHPMT